ncbi:MAG: hypothetical protein WKH64_07640 [Chloroflexia bacterium]
MADGAEVRWERVRRESDRLSGVQRDVMWLVMRLPLLPQGTVRALLPHIGERSVYRAVAVLKERGLVAGVDRLTRPWGRLHLQYATTLGLAVMAYRGGFEPRSLAATMRASRPRPRTQGSRALARCRRVRLLVRSVGPLPGSRRATVGASLLRVCARSWTADPPIGAGASLCWDGGAEWEYLLVADLGGAAH